MEKPRTAFDIYNMALSKLGEPCGVLYFDPSGSLPQRLGYYKYHPARRNVLVDMEPKFALRTVILEKDDGLGFKMPTDCLLPVNTSAYSWTVLGNHIQAKADRLELTYVADIEDVSLFDEDFINAFVIKLALDVSFELTNSKTQKALLVEEYSRLIKVI